MAAKGGNTKAENGAAWERQAPWHSALSTIKFDDWDEPWFARNSDPRKIERPSWHSQTAQGIMRAKIEPVVVDMARDKTVLKQIISSALQTAPPMFAVINYGFEDKFVNLKGDMRRHYALSQNHSDSKCVSLSIAELDGGKTEMDLSGDLRRLTLQICDVVMGNEFAERLASEKQDVDGAISMRFYPKASGASEEYGESSNRLGAHVDANFMTVLWSDAVGLQVPRASAPLNNHEVAGYGIPTVGCGGISAMSEEDWADVIVPANSLLVTIGQGWFESVASHLPLRAIAIVCPTWRELWQDMGEMKRGAVGGSGRESLRD